MSVHFLSRHDSAIGAVPHVRECVRIRADCQDLCRGSGDVAVYHCCGSVAGSLLTAAGLSLLRIRNVGTTGAIGAVPHVSVTVCTTS